MTNEQKHQYLKSTFAFMCGGIFWVLLLCLICIPKMEAALSETHRQITDRDKTIAEDEAVLHAASDTLQFQINHPAPPGCEGALSENVTASVDRPHTSTYLVYLQTDSMNRKLPSIHLNGLAGLIFDLLQQKYITAGSTAGKMSSSPGLVWALPYKVEPTLAGDVNRAWILHVDMRTGQPVGEPHHPVALQVQEQ